MRLLTLALILTLTLTPTHSHPLFSTYKSNLFAAVSSSEPHPLTLGLLWWSTPPLPHILSPRHATTEDGMGSYTWTLHDGHSAASQLLIDHKMGLSLNLSLLLPPAFPSSDPDLSLLSLAVDIDWLTPSPPSPDRTISFALYVSAPSATLAPPSSLRARASGLDWGKGPVLVSASSPAVGDATILLPQPDLEYPPRPQRNGKQLRARDPQKLHVLHALLPDHDRWKVADVVATRLRESALASLTGKARLMDAAAAKRARQAGSPPPKTKTDPGRIAFPPDVIPAIGNVAPPNGESNLVILQASSTRGFTLQAALLYGPAAAGLASSEEEAMAAAQAAGAFGPQRSERMDAAAAGFHARFEETYGLASKGYSEEYVGVARAALSNLIGGLSYFHGASRIAASPSGSKSAYGEVHPLLTCVPSRSFFPRGFMWDEGFHQLLLSSWDPSLSQDVLASWLETMDDNGWIAREQILGPEAESRVPDEFVTQFRSYANPPTLLLPIAAMASDLHAQVTAQMGDLMDEHSGSADSTGKGLDAEATMAFLQRAYPLLKRQFEWFLSTQNGNEDQTFRWRGRTPNHTLTSGLDDYPRSEVVSDKEKHVDLASWMVLASRLLAKTADLLGHTSDASAYAEQAESLLAKLHQTHWNQETGVYADIGVTSSSDDDDEEEPSFVEATGYISVFPLATGLLDGDDPRVGPLLEALGDPEGMWSSAGIRSLAKSDPGYGVGENYWRGPIWINLNYLILSGLHSLAEQEGTVYADQARQLYDGLRTNVVDTIVSSYLDTGYFWEQYHPEHGHGDRTHPFAGWTTLVVLIMAEQYPF